MKTKGALLLVGGLFLTACAQKDTTAPPAPRVHPVKSPTSTKTVVITGAAEFASTVKFTGGAQDVTVQADPFTAEFLAEVPLNTVIPAGSISVKNEIAVTATDAAGNESAPTSIEVLFGPEPGKPAELNFTLTGGAASGTIAAGDQVTYSYKVTDAYGGPVANPLDVIPSWPSAVVFDDGISGTGLIMGMTRAGSFTITARATGAAGVSKVVPLAVTPAKGNRYLDLSLTLARMATGDTTAALTVVKDLYGNVIIADTDGTPAGLALACAAQAVGTPAAACSKSGNRFTVTKSGVYKITATYDDGANPAATTSQYVFVEDMPDVVPPTAHIDAILYPGATAQVPRNTNSRIEVQLTFADDKGLAQATLYALFGNNPACVSASGTLLLTGGLNITTSASVRMPNCAFPFDSISLFAQVLDQAGNQGFSPFNTALTVSGASLGNGLAPAAGYALGVVGLNGNLQNGADVAFDSAAQIAYVTRPGSQLIYALLPDRTQATVRDITGQDYQPNGAIGIAVSGAGELFVGHYNTTNIAYIPPSLPVNPPSLVTGLNGPTRLVYDSRPAKPVVCAARTGSNFSMNCYVFDSSVNPVTLTRNFPSDVVPSPTPGGNNTEIAGIAVGAKDGLGNYTLWLLYNGCALYSTTTKFDGTQPVQPTVALTVTPAFTGGPATCTDIAGLPSGDVAILDTANQTLVRVTPAGAATTIVTGLSQPTGLDYSGSHVYILDQGSRSVLQVAAPAGSPF